MILDKSPNSLELPSLLEISTEWLEPIRSVIGTTVRRMSNRLTRDRKQSIGTIEPLRRPFRPRSDQWKFLKRKPLGNFDLRRGRAAKEAEQPDAVRQQKPMDKNNRSEDVFEEDKSSR
jgi:hypothetical protein